MNHFGSLDVNHFKLGFSRLLEVIRFKLEFTRPDEVSPFKFSFTTLHKAIHLGSLDEVTSLGPLQVNHFGPLDKVNHFKLCCRRDEESLWTLFY